MSVATKPAEKLDAAALMDQLNTETAKLNAWIRVEANSPAQRPWFADTGGATGAGQLATGRVSRNQMKMLAHRWRWKDIYPYLRQISEIAASAKGELLERTDRGIEQIAADCGLTPLMLRRHFARRWGITPQAYRHRFTQLAS